MVRRKDEGPVAVDRFERSPFRLAGTKVAAIQEGKTEGRWS